MKILQFNECLICIYQEGETIADIKYDIIEEIGVLSENSKGWRKELNKISWNGAAPKHDICDWAPEHEKMARVLPLDMSEIAN